jgi:DNA polymerase-1
MRKKLFLIDGSSYLYRAYYAMKPLHTISGEPVQAVYGFVRMIKKLIDTYDPAYMALVWDSPGATVRHEIFPEYKATRQAPPHDIFTQKARIQEFADLIGLRQFATVGVEADDIMYSIATDAHKDNFDVILVTSDKDMGQMLDEHTIIVDTFKDIVMDSAAFEQKMSFPVAKLPFYFALVGDSSDNIPGVRGIGKTGALELVQQFASLEDLYTNLDAVKKPRMRNALQEGREMAFLSYDLFLLRYHAIADFSPAACGYDKKMWHQADTLFASLNFKSLLSRTAAAQQASADPAQASIDVAQKPLNKPDYTFTVVTTSEQLAKLAQELRASNGFAIDTETTGLRAGFDTLIGISFATQAGHAWYVPFGHTTIEQQLSKEEVFAALKDIIEDPAYPKYLHHASFDAAMLWHAGITLQGIAFDTMLAAKLVNREWQKAGLKELSEFYLHERMLSFAETVTAAGYKHFGYVPLQKAGEYAAADAHQTLRLYALLREKLKEEGMLQLYMEIEHPLLQLLVRMEQAGIMVDVSLLKGLGTQVQKALIDLEDSILTAAGPEHAGINLNSPRQVEQLLFGTLQLPPQKKSAKGSYSTDTQVLRALAKLHPIPGYIAQYRELAKLKNTYIDALPEYVQPTSSKIHTSFSQTAVATGRLASSDPNLQNIPTGQGYGKQIRSAFKPEPGHCFVSIDYSQIELRVMAYLSQDPQLLYAFEHCVDVHTQTAAALFQVSLDQVTHEQRQIGKRINFSVLYGMTPFGLSKDLEIPFKEAKQYIDSYFEQYKGVQRWMDEVVEQTKEQGYVSTLWGRRRYLPSIYERNQSLYQEAVRVAINTRVQGTAADIMKIGMVRLEQAFNAAHIDARILLQIHDELLVSVASVQEPQAKDIAQQVLEHVTEWNVPFEVTIRSGSDWQEVTK